MRPLVNGKPQSLDGENAEKTLEPFSRFPASMICITTALDSLATSPVVRTILHRLLKELLRTTEYGEEVLVSQISSRLNSRLSSTSREMRGRLLGQRHILDGFMPIGEVTDVVNFLVWLL